MLSSLCSARVRRARAGPAGRWNSNSVLARSMAASGSDTSPRRGRAPMRRRPRRLRGRRGTAAARRRARACGRATRWPTARAKCSGRTSGRFRPGRRALQVVAARDRVVRVEDVAELPRDARQLVERDAPVPRIRSSSNRRTTSLPRDGTARRRARAPPRGRGARPAPRRAGSPLPDPSNCIPDKMKKWAGAHFRTVSEASEPGPITWGYPSRNAPLPRSRIFRRWRLRRATR